MPRVTLDQARAAQQSALNTFSRLGDVVGIGIARQGDGYAIKVNLRRPLRAGVVSPRDIDGVPVKVEIVGSLVKR
jgi:hypothetical protein